MFIKFLLQHIHHYTGTLFASQSIIKLVNFTPSFIIAQIKYRLILPLNLIMLILIDFTKFLTFISSQLFSYKIKTLSYYNWSHKVKYKNKYLIYIMMKRLESMKQATIAYLITNQATIAYFVVVMNLNKVLTF